MSQKNREKLDRPALDRVAKLFSAFSDGTRLAILQELMEGRLTVGELVSRVGGSQGNVSKQLQLLHDSDLLSREKEGNQVFYSISDQIVVELCQLVCEKLNRDSQAAAALSFEI
ncbi:MAG: metalloregulator ArsR/SmtB family transcription factor [Verrucomicrobiales bacterium]|nr:metalloregulator ArsR/SmtB family transcription factor [Verrucomicrobiales bacterium]